MAQQEKKCRCCNSEDGLLEGEKFDRYGNLIGKIYVCKKCLSMYSSMYSSGLQVLSQ